MRAHARKRTDKPSKRRHSKRDRVLRTPPPPPSPPAPPRPNVHYEAAWTDSWSHRRCLHKHRTLLEAAECAMPNGAGWYVFAVENDEPRELRDEEDEIVNRYRFSPRLTGL
jgi:hypothetical protein